jgi:hypothetical protein
MSLIRISESDGWIVDYDRVRGMYRVSYFEDNHFLDEFWFDAFDAYEENEVTNKTELIRYLQVVKQNGKRILGDHKALNKSRFEYFMDQLIVQIEERL